MRVLMFVFIMLVTIGLPFFITDYFHLDMLFGIIIGLIFGTIGGVAAAVVLDSY